MQYTKECLQKWLGNLRFSLSKLCDKSSNNATSHSNMLRAAKLAGTIGSTLEHFLATGNIKTVTGLGLMQEKGLTIIPENINRMRYMSHYRAIHRGSFFLEMRTTEARQLLPDHWGFVCPVHTPDGAPCGLLNHLTMNCLISEVADAQKVANIPGTLVLKGMIPINKASSDRNIGKCYTVQLDGRVLGYLPEDDAYEAVEFLRLKKILGEDIPNMLEIVLVPKKKYPGQYPGLFLFTGPARMMRPVVHLKTGKIEFIGTFEQVSVGNNADIAVF